ncbi:MAG: NUMOD3 domain-containing DNA-binding protein [Planctomycetota bacterium]
MTLAGVYEIRNIINGHCYIGSSTRVAVRMHRHKTALENCRHGNIHLQRAWDKYGEDNFIFRPLLYCDPGNALLYEQMCMDGLRPKYNIAKDAAAPMTGLNLSKEHRTKISKSMTGKVRTKEHQEKLSATHRGSKRSEEARRRMSIAHKGVALSKEHIQHRVESRRGYRHSEETKQKISASHIGKTYSEETLHNMSEGQKKRFSRSNSVSEETRKKLSDAGKGRVPTLQARQNMSAAQMGKTFSDEHRANLRAAWEKRRARNGDKL